MTAKMRVKLIGQTAFFTDDDVPWFPEIGDTDADSLVEHAGRECYQSWGRPNPSTATNKGYVANIIDHQHYSVLEHASYTMRISGVSRTLTHELVRHRHFSFSQLSQRYVDESDAGFVVPPVIRDLEDKNLSLALEATLNRVMVKARNDYEYLYGQLVEQGLTKKEARGAARAVLPGMTETTIVVTGNVRSWREFFQKRDTLGADQEIRELAKAVFETIQPYSPNALQDFVEEK